MEERRALHALSALSHETRLRIVRTLVQAGPEGVAAGMVAEAVKASPSTVSFHLKELEHAGLARSRRVARSIIYSAEYATLSGLISFLMHDCCQGNPAVCVPAMAALQACCETKEPEHV